MTTKEQRRQQGQQQIPFGDDNKTSNDKTRRTATKGFVAGAG
jgi:hypothetical protein